MLQRVCGISILDSDMLKNLFTYYFIGMIVSRVGSIVVEPVAKKTKLVSYADYNDYIMASKIDAKIEVLSETNNLYRSLSAVGLLILIIEIYVHVGRHLQALPPMLPWVFPILLLIIFLISFRKQTQFIKRRVDIAIQNEREESEKRGQ